MSAQIKNLKQFIIVIVSLFIVTVSIVIIYRLTYRLPAPVEQNTGIIEGSHLFTKNGVIWTIGNSYITLLPQGLSDDPTNLICCQLDSLTKYYLTKDNGVDIIPAKSINLSDIKQYENLKLTYTEKIRDNKEIQISCTRIEISRF